ncbi:MAG: hypothetical protein IJL00_00300 [Clostridia bacterium]|nr:hypothetical protein [Clostridia bacterium]
MKIVPFFEIIDDLACTIAQVLSFVNKFLSFFLIFMQKTGMLHSDEDGVFFDRRLCCCKPRAKNAEKETQ